MILSEKNIRELSQKSNNPLISPFNEKRLQGASYDVSLSGNIAAMKRLGEHIDPSVKTDLSHMYQYITVGDNGYSLSPGEYILAELQEEICLPDTLAAHIRPRTRFTRGGLMIADQHCNPTYHGKLQIGLFNAGVNSFTIRPGIIIAQLVFEEISSAPSEDKLYKNKPEAAYSDEKEFRGALYGEAGWTEDMKDLYASMIHELSGGKNSAK